MAVPHASAAVATQVIVEPLHVHPPSVPQREIEGLAASLLDLCSGYEGGLRALVSMQRNLERIRRGDAVTAEAGLLLQELSRQLEGLTGTGGALAERQHAARQHLESVMRGYAP